MRVVFHTSHLKTKFFHALAVRLEKMGHEIFWISNTNRWTKWLMNHGIPASHLLDVTAFGTEWAGKKSLTPDEESELRHIERAGGVTVNNLILMDRLLSLKPRTYARAYLYVAGREIRRFLVEKQADVLFLEATWASELLTVIICQEIGRLCYCPRPVRIPSNQSAFFDGYMQSSIAFIREPDDNDRVEATKFYDYFLSKEPRPGYWYTVSCRIPKLRATWMKKLFLHLRLQHDDPFDETCPSPMSLVSSRLSEVWNKWVLSVARPFESVQLPSRRPYVLYALHQQPEASIDVVGAYFSNQIELIKSLARSIPSTHELYIKEHRASIGVRSLAYHRTLQRIPCVRLIDPYADSHQLIRNADLVVSVSGTIAYEAALYGTPAMTVAPMYFGPVLTGNGINPYRESFGEIFDILCGNRKRDDAENVRQRNIEFLAWLIAQSFEGIISDPESEPNCMAPENLDSVAQAMDVLLAKQAEHSHAL